MKNLNLNGLKCIKKSDDSYGLEGDPNNIQKRAETIVETDYKEIQSLKKWMNNLKEKTHLSYLGLTSPSRDQKAIQLAT